MAASTKASLANSCKLLLGVAISVALMGLVSPAFAGQSTDPSMKDHIETLVTNGEKGTEAKKATKRLKKMRTEPGKMSASLINKIKFIPRSWLSSNQSLEVKFKQPRKNTGVARFEYRKLTNDIEVTIGRKKLKIDAEPADYFTTTDIGTVDLSTDGNEDIFVVMEGGGSSNSLTHLYLINTEKVELIGLELEFGWYKWPPYPRPDNPIIGIHTINFDKLSLQREREFLDSIKYEFGFIDEKTAQNNPEYAYYFWKKDNGGAVVGKEMPYWIAVTKDEEKTMKIRKYKGKYWIDKHRDPKEELKHGTTLSDITANPGHLS